MSSFSWTASQSVESKDLVFFIYLTIYGENTLQVLCGLVKEPATTGPGPWGGDGGKPWDDGVYSGIKQVYITRGDFINSIQIEYDRSGQSVWSTRHGGSGEISHRVKIKRMLH